MKRLLLIPLLLLCSCIATQAALDKLNLKIGDATVAAAEAKAVAENPNATQLELDAAMDKMVKEGTEAKEALVAVKEAMIADAQNAAGFTGMGGGMDGGLIGLGLTGLAWFMRDRRKKLGLDPLQRRDVVTPPTIGYPGPGDTVPTAPPTGP